MGSIVFPLIRPTVTVVWRTLTYTLASGLVLSIGSGSVYADIPPSSSMTAPAASGGTPTSGSGSPSSPSSSGSPNSSGTANSTGTSGSKTLGEQVFALTDDLLKMRDPFRAPDKNEDGPAKSELEQYSVESFKLVGVLTGLEHLRALVQAPDGKTFFVAEKTKIGLRGGMIRKILPESVKIRERNINVVGQVENVDSELVMSSKGDSSMMSKITLAEPVSALGSVFGSVPQLGEVSANLNSLVTPKVDIDGNEQGKPK